MQTAEQLAARLIGTKHKPPGLDKALEEARRAWAYHRLKPYPEHGFKTWKKEDRGTLPRCMPLPRRMLKRGARFLFGKGIEINCAKNTDLEEYLRAAWTGNQMPARAVAMAEKSAIEGGCALKFSYDPKARVPLQIQTLSLVDHVRLFYHPHDRNRLLMARIQYSFFDPESGSTKWYREEWTDAEEVHYEPLGADTLGGGSPDTSDQWKESSRKANPFGLIPVQPIKNLETDDLWGCGDLWDLWEIFDEFNLIWWQMKRSNQFDSELNPIFLDADVDDEGEERPLAPGEALKLTSDTPGEKSQGKVFFPNGSNELRPAMMDYARELKKQLEEAGGAASVDAAEVTNKGNLTQAVLTQLYQVLLEITGEKRKSYGQGGIEIFFEKCAQGLQSAGVPLGVNAGNEDTYNVEIGWPAHFELSEEEKTVKTGRVQEQEMAGYTTHERAVDAVAQMEGVRDIPALKEELEKEPRPSPSETDPNAAKQGLNEGEPREPGD